MRSSVVTTSRVVAIGRVFFAVGMIGIGCQHFFFGQFVPLVVPHWAASIPGRLFWVYLAGTILVVGGAAILSGFKARTAATLLGGLFLLSAVLLQVPGYVMAGVKVWVRWYSAFEAFSFAGCALVVAGTLPRTGGRGGWRTPIEWLDKLIPWGMVPFAILVIVFGVDHYLDTAAVATLVPAWIPFHIFWTYFVGTALIAAGLGMILRVKARLAATLLGAMLLTWVLVLHIPRAIADPYSGIGEECTNALEALAESGVAFILGATLGRKRAEAGLGGPASSTS